MKKIFLTHIFLLIASQTSAQLINSHRVANCEEKTLRGNLAINKQGTWNKVYRQTFVMPDSFSKINYFHQVIDYDQVVYQSCRSLDDEIWNNNRLTYFINRWGTDTVNCSAEIINSFINGVIAMDEDSLLYYSIDENNNYNFKDEEFFLIEDTINRQHNILFERFEKGRVLEDSVLIRLKKPKYDEDGNVKGFDYYYCEYRKGEVEINDQIVNVVLKPGDWYTYHKSPQIIISTLDGENPIITVNQYFRIGKSYFRIKKINRLGTEITIEKYIGNGVPTSNQKAYAAPPIDVNGVNILDSYKGYYTYIYFWNISCAPCLKAIPRLKKYLDEKLGSASTNFKVLLVSVGPPEEHREFLHKQNIEWQNIETFGNSKIFNDYGIEYYPTELMIDPNGHILLGRDDIIDIRKFAN